MRSPINIVGGFYKDPNKHWSAQDTLNWIPVKSERSGTRTEWQFRDAPGVKPLVKLGVNSGGDFIEAGPGRGLRNVEGKLFAVAGNTLFQITNDLVSIPYGTIPGVNRVSMAHNQYGSANQLLTVNGSAGYVFNTSTLEFEKITDTGYPGAFVADYVDGYLAQVESLGRYWFHSDLAEAREYNTLDQYEAEGDPDRIVTLHVAYREVLLFGADTIEPYVNAPRGSGIAPFQRAANTVIQCGCSAKFSPRNIAGVVPFLDDKRVVQYLQGYSVNRISTVGIEQALGECSREEISNAYAYTYEDRGHKIYYLTVPGRFTFGYDFLTQEWHRRATSGLPDLAFTDVAFWNGMWVALDRRYGRLYELDWSYKLDSCEPLVRERVTGILSNNQNRVTVNELELLFNVGTEESVCQPFEEQPEGPTITGNAPDGNVGSPWGPYSYTVTGGTPPYVVTLRPGGSLPAGIGPLSASGTIAAGEPTTEETKTFTVRATDANGLFDELEDTIEIGAVLIGLEWQYNGTFSNNVQDVCFGDLPTGGLFVACAIGLLGNGEVWTTTDGAVWTQRTDGQSWQYNSCAFGLVDGDPLFVVRRDFNNVISSPDGITWTPHTTATSTAYQITVFDGERFIGVGNGNSAEYSADGSTWTSSPRPDSQTARVGLTTTYEGDPVTLIFCAAGAIHRSINSGTSWSSITVPADPSPSDPFGGAITDGTTIRAYKYASSVLTTYSSTDGGQTWTWQQDNVGASNYKAGKGLFRNGKWFALGATVSGGQQVELWYSEDGLVPWLPADVLYYVDTDPATMYAIAASDERAVLVGTKGGGSTSGFSMTSPVLDP